METLKESNIFDFDVDKKINKYPIIELEDSQTNTKIKTLISVNGDVKVKDIEEISEIINEDYSIHSAIILYNGIFTESAQKIINIKGLGIDDKNSIIDLEINTSVAKKLIFGFKSNNENKYKKFVDKEIYSEVCKKILEDLNFKNKINNWLKIQENKGMVINQIQLRESPSSRVFADGLKLYLNYDGSYTPEDIQKKNEEGLLKFKKYGGRGGLITSDFEDSSRQISLVSFDLYKNGFLEKEDEEYKVKVNPIEIRLLEIIKNKKIVSLKDLQKYFIIRDKNEKNLEIIYLNILTYKGLINRKGKKFAYFYEIVNKEDAFDNLKKEYEEYKKNIDTENFILFGHYYEQKQKADKLIILGDFDHFITKTFKEVESSLDQENALLKINICKKLLLQFTNEFKEAIEQASVNASSLINDVNSEKLSLDKSFENIAEKSEKWLKISFNKENISEYSGLNSDYEDIISIYKKIYGKDELLRETKKIENNFKTKFGKDKYRDQLIDVFGFKKNNTAKPFFNIKFYLIEEKKGLLDDKIRKIQKKIESIDIKFDEINDRQDELKERLDRIKKTISKNNKLAYYMYKELEKADIISNNPVKPLEDNLELSALLKSTENSIKEIGDRIGLVIKLTEFIDTIGKTEETFLEILKNTKGSSIKYNNLCDLDCFKNDLKRLDDEIKKYETIYEDTDLEEFKDDKNKRKNIVKDLEMYSKNLNLSKDSLELEWDTFQNENERDASKLNKIIRIIVKKEEIKDKEEIKEIKDSISNLQDLTKIKLEDTNKPASYFENLKENLNTESYKIINKYLANDERKLLLTLESIKSGWLDYDEIKSITKELGMEKNSFDEAIQGLVEKGYLQRGFLLTV